MEAFGSADTVWLLLAEPTTVDDLIVDIASIYGVEVSEVADVVQSLLSQWITAGHVNELADA